MHVGSVPPPDDTRRKKPVMSPSPTVLDGRVSEDQKMSYDDLLERNRSLRDALENLAAEYKSMAVAYAASTTNHSPSARPMADPGKDPLLISVTSALEEVTVKVERQREEADQLRKALMQCTLERDALYRRCHETEQMNKQLSMELELLVRHNPAVSLRSAANHETPTRNMDREYSEATEVIREAVDVTSPLTGSTTFDMSARFAITNETRDIEERAYSAMQRSRSLRQRIQLNTAAKHLW